MATIRQLESGKWRAEIRIKGFDPQRKTLRTKSQAITWSQRVEDSMRIGTFKQSGGMLLSELLSRFLREIVPMKKTTRYHRDNVKRLSAALGHVAVLELTANDIVDYVRYRRETVSPSTVRKEVNTLSHAIDIGIALWDLKLIANPCANAKIILKTTKAITEPEPRSRRLLDGEEGRLFKALEVSKPTKLIAALTLATGRRLKELMRVYDSIETRNGTAFIRVRDNKTDHQIIVPLSDIASQLIADNIAIDIKSGSISQAFLRATKRANIVDLTLTDLRHECFSRYFELGYSVAEVMAISGHKTPDTLLKVYTQINAEKLSARLASDLVG